VIPVWNEIGDDKHSPQKKRRETGSDSIGDCGYFQGDFKATGTIGYDR